MIKTLELYPDITLRCYQDDRFKQGALSIQFLRPMCREEAALNALLPTVLLRGSCAHPDLRAITLKLDDLYGASVSALVRRIGDIQTTGFFSAFLEDRFALPGDRILEPMVAFLGELLLQPVRENGVFSGEFVAGEKKNLISTIESELNDKRAYAASQLMRLMCREDSYGIARLGDRESAAAITAQTLYQHYQKVLSQSPVELFYVGSARPEQVAQALKPLFASLSRQVVALPPQTPYRDSGAQHRVETMDVTQAKLCMGFVTPITNRSDEFAAMQVCSALFGAGQTSKLFMNIREKMSLCYSIGSAYYGSKGLVTVSAGIDADKDEVVRQEIFAQLDACRRGDFTAEELKAAKEGILSGLRGIHDSPGAIESYYATAAISGLRLTPQSYMAAVEAVDAAGVCAAAASIRAHSTYLLKGGAV